MGTHEPQRKLEIFFDVILQDETNRDTCSKVITCSHSTILINKIVLDQLIKDLRHQSLNQNLSQMWNGQFKSWFPNLGS